MDSVTSQNPQPHSRLWWSIGRDVRSPVKGLFTVQCGDTGEFNVQFDFCIKLLCPPPTGRGHIDFGADPIVFGVGVVLGVTPSCLHNSLWKQWLDSYQSVMDIHLGHNKEFIGFWWSWPNFQGHSSRTTEISQYVGRGRGHLKTTLLVSFIIACKIFVLFVYYDFS